MFFWAVYAVNLNHFENKDLSKWGRIAFSRKIIPAEQIAMHPSRQEYRFKCKSGKEVFWTEIFSEILSGFAQDSNGQSSENFHPHGFIYCVILGSLG